MTSSQPLVDDRSAAFSRLVGSMVLALNKAVDRRKREGVTASQIDIIGCDKGALSRVLNGTTRNITLRTISDILWATSHDPEPFSVDAIEDICPNWVSGDLDINIRICEIRTVTDKDLWAQAKETVEASVVTFSSENPAMVHVL